jgi:flagellar protein FlaJ
MIAISFEQKVGLISILLAAALIVIGFLSGDVGTLSNLFIIAMLIVIITTFTLKYAHRVWLKSLEAQFPNFVRDLADSIRSGMSLKEAITLASKANYGKLSDEVKAMAGRLSWGTSVSRVLDIFAKKTSGSTLIGEAIKIMKEGHQSGGNFAATLDAIARNIIAFKELEADRASMARSHVAIMYGIFFMFLGIAVMIIFIMVPMIKSQPTVTGTFGLTFSNPCQNIHTFPCDYFSILGYVFDIKPGISQYYTSLYFTAVIIQGIFTGLIAGQLGESSVLAGSKHALIMAMSAFGVFLFLTKAGLIPL